MYVNLFHLQCPYDCLLQVASAIKVIISSLDLSFFNFILHITVKGLISRSNLICSIDSSSYMCATWFTIHHDWFIISYLKKHQFTHHFHKYVILLLNNNPYVSLHIIFQTIVLVPVLPLGVLQFGSLKKVCICSILFEWTYTGIVFSNIRVTSAWKYDQISNVDL